MTRLEAIAAINAKLAALDDARVLTVAEMIDDIATATATATVRPLTARELALLEQSKEDFAAGRTYSVEDVRAHSDALIQALRDKHATTS
ncbi:MAG: hypothetical protein ABL901_17410 [Hyphomicrobiaceae bacterium]